MKLLAVILSVILSIVLLAEARPIINHLIPGSLLQGRVFEDNGIAVDSVPKRQAPAAADYADKILMLETNKLPSLSKYFSMHEW